MLVRHHLDVNRTAQDTEAWGDWNHVVAIVADNHVDLFHVRLLSNSQAYLLFCQELYFHQNQPLTDPTNRPEYRNNYTKWRIKGENSPKYNKTKNNT